jgi:hypothetical protein
MNEADKKRVTTALTSLYAKRAAQVTALAATDMMIAKAEAELVRMLSKSAAV